MQKLIAILLVLTSLQVSAQTLKSENDQPKLVVGIVVDQMRQEYLYRFHSKYGEGGFKRLMNEGFMLKNAHYNYAPTVTGPGHASVYTGTTPAFHGIIANDFYHKRLSKIVNCVEDPLQKPVGSELGNGDVSPWRMLSSTITDELKLFTQKRSKVIGVSIKDRGAVLPAGHMADAAYWFDSGTGKFITSTYYMAKLPDWVVKFNDQNLANKYLSQTWNTLLPIEQYTESGPDDSPYEIKLGGKLKPTFPYVLSEMRLKYRGFDLITTTPFGNNLLTEMAMATVTGEQMGKDYITDFLCVSYSSTDILGHAVGPNAVEIEDMYLRLDKSLEEFLKKLDQQVGAGNYTVFLTADHAVADVPQYLKDSKIPAGYFSDAFLKAKLTEYLLTYYPNKTLISDINNYQIFLNQDAFQHDAKATGVDMFIATELIGKFLMSMEGISNYYTEASLRQGSYDEKSERGDVIRGYNAQRSGDIVYTLQPGWYESGSVTGTTHGSTYKYDTHVPILFYGKGIKKGSTSQYHAITDIAPTLSILLNIKFPSGCTGQPISEIVDNN
ncbi:MAG TPA: alkaline phosphatase family protein [Chryseolinea sp.]|nr:alkaline phosphatase family protein [Chryseolinea sp.]HPM32089.1 alkaline phosphatase family protein [Chryseolinea sp.]